MLVPLSWLADFVDLPGSVEALAERLRGVVRRFLGGRPFAIRLGERPARLAPANR